MSSKRFGPLPFGISNRSISPTLGSSWALKVDKNAFILAAPLSLPPYLRSKQRASRRAANCNRIVRNFSGIFFGFPLSEKRSGFYRREKQRKLLLGGRRALGGCRMGNILPLLDDDGALLHLEGPLEWHPVQAISALRDLYRIFLEFYSVNMYKFSWYRAGI